MNTVSLPMTNEDAVLNRVLKWFRPTRVTLLIGGAARSLHSGEQVKDYDFAFGSKTGLDEFVAHLGRIGAVKVAETYTLEDRLSCEDFVFRFGPAQEEYTYIQVKHEFYSSLSDLFATTDLTIAQFCCMISLGGRNLVASEQGAADLEGKLLRLHNVTSPVSTLARWLKFKDRGYEPVDDDERLSELHVERTNAGLKRKRHIVANWRELFNVPEVLS